MYPSPRARISITGFCPWAGCKTYRRGSDAERVRHRRVSQLLHSGVTPSNASRESNFGRRESTRPVAKSTALAKYIGQERWKVDEVDLKVTGEEMTGTRSRGYRPGEGRNDCSPSTRAPSCIIVVPAVVALAEHPERYSSSTSPAFSQLVSRSKGGYGDDRRRLAVPHITE